MKFSFEKKAFIEFAIDADKKALIGAERDLSWREFEHEVSRLSQFLLKENLSTVDRPVIIYGHKELEMVIAIYTCIANNIPYIPIDEVYPIERVQKIAEVAEVKLIINCSTKALNFENCSEIAYTKLKAQLIHKQNHLFEATKNPKDLVYIIFTSGSTGEPKGVQISQEAVLSFQKWMTSDFGFSADDVFVNVALFSFDLSVYELLTFASMGATLLLNTKKHVENPDEFLNRIAAHKGSIWVSTPSFSFIYSRNSFEQIKQHIKFFLFCGEVLPYNLTKNLKTNYPDSIIYNTYGPTEATVATTLVEITNEILEKYNPLPVGYPKLESELIIDEDEIVIVGKNVSIGYLNRPDLNETKFITIKGERAFKTGDLGYIEDGMLFCKGRNDNQVKLHGYRIELEEITAKLKELSTIENAATIALKHNGETKKIVSFVVSNQQELKMEIIKENLAKLIPSYMIPSDIRLLTEIPLNNNGKTDSKKLEELYFAN